MQISHKRNIYAPFQVHGVKENSTKNKQRKKKNTHEEPFLSLLILKPDWILNSSPLENASFPFRLLRLYVSSSSLLGIFSFLLTVMWEGEKYLCLITVMLIYRGGKTETHKSPYCITYAQKAGFKDSKKCLQEWERGICIWLSFCWLSITCQIWIKSNFRLALLSSNFVQQWALKFIVCSSNTEQIQLWAGATNITGNHP